MNKSFMISSLVFFLSIGFVPLLAAAEQAAGKSKTLENLMAAFNGESNAHNRYLAFAKKADEEGYGQVASLFRAAAAAEKVHFEHHAAVIADMGGTPKADLTAPEVKSTRENLEAAIKGESYERDVMYPEFVAEAKATKNTSAFRTFTYALKVEAVHAALYKDALDKLDSLKGSSKKDYYICPVCGNTVAALDFKTCVISGTPRGKFTLVN